MLRRIEVATASKEPFLLSTVNLNFLVNSQSDPEFREALLSSDLCTADGVAIVWISWLVGVPIRNRVAGSDLFDALKVAFNSAEPLKVFLFGGAEGVAAAACRALNAQRSGLHCAGSFFPGYCSIDEMSRDEIIDNINSSGADFLVAALGAQKGQLWLRRNHRRFLISVRAHLGAVINFQAATVRRAPPIVRKFALEWLWRIKEEPYLWRRYWNDGNMLLPLLVTRLSPLAFWTWWLRVKNQRCGQELIMTQAYSEHCITLSLSGPAIARNVERIIPVLRDAIASKKQIIIDFSNTRAIDARFLGLLLMLRKTLKGNGAGPIFKGLSPRLERIFRLNGPRFLTDEGI